MLVVLSEINCLYALRKLHVYPDRFYTDEVAFKNESAMFSDATVIVIFGGGFRFNKRLMVNQVKTLLGRVESKLDTGIKAVYVFSDSTLSGLYSYYKYHGTLAKVDVMRGWDVVTKDAFPWTKLQTEEKESALKLSDWDKGDATQAREVYKARRGTTADDSYMKLIKVPQVRNGVITVN